MKISRQTQLEKPSSTYLTIFLKAVKGMRNRKDRGNVTDQRRLRGTGIECDVGCRSGSLNRKRTVMEKLVIQIKSRV